MAPATFLLVPGAGGEASYWSELGPLLTAGGHEAVAIDIPEDDPALGLPEYARIVSVRRRPGGRSKRRPAMTPTSTSSGPSCTTYPPTSGLDRPRCRRRASRPTPLRPAVPHERLGVDARVVPGGHLLALADAPVLAAVLTGLVGRV